MAIAFTILSYPHIINRNWKKFTIFVLIAFLCHQTALVFIPVYFIYGITNRKKLILFLIAIGVFLYISILVLINKFALLFVGFGSYVDSNEGNITSIIISICYLFTYMFFLKGRVFLDGIYRLVFILLVLNFIVLFAGHSFTAINRLMMYYTVGNILAVPLTMQHIKLIPIRCFYCMSVLSLLIYLFCYGSNAEYLNAI